MNADLLDVEISLVNTNNRDLLERCLASLPAACDGLRWHVTVVDNASTDGSAEMVADLFPWARVLRNESRLGFGANHNQVIRPVVEKARARYALVLNEDTEASEHSVAALIACCDGRPDAGAAGPLLIGSDGIPQRTYFELPTLFAGSVQRLRLARRRAPRPRRGYLYGACVLIRTEALRAVGVFDERFFIFYEDTDLCRRLWDAGWASIVCEQATVMHREHHTVSKAEFNVAMAQQMLRSRFLYHEKHFGRRRASLAAWVARCFLTLRALKASAERIRRREPGELRHARLLFTLARYDPRWPLAHEARPATHRP